VRRATASSRHPAWRQPPRDALRSRNEGTDALRLTLFRAAILSIRRFRCALPRLLPSSPRPPLQVACRSPRARVRRQRCLERLRRRSGLCGHRRRAGLSGLPGMGWLLWTRLLWPPVRATVLPAVLSRRLCRPGRVPGAGRLSRAALRGAARRRRRHAGLSDLLGRCADPPSATSCSGSGRSRRRNRPTRAATRPARRARPPDGPTRALLAASLRRTAGTRSLCLRRA